MIDRKGILAFLAITFGLTWAIEIPPIMSGMRLTGVTSSAGQYIFLPIMVMPALGAILTAKLITREGLGGMSIRFGSWKMYVLTGLLFPACFVLIYALTALLGFGQPDWNLDYFKSLFVANGAPVPASFGNTCRATSNMLFWRLTVAMFGQSKIDLHSPAGAT